MKYKKYFRKTSLKQKGVGDFFLEEVEKKSPKTFLEVGVFHGVTARNICELLNKIHKGDFKYIGLDLFEESKENIAITKKLIKIAKELHKSDAVKEARTTQNPILAQQIIRSSLLK